MPIRPEGLRELSETVGGAWPVRVQGGQSHCGRLSEVTGGDISGSLKKG